MSTEEIEKHDCYEHLEINEDSDGSGYDDYLICSVCSETYAIDRYVCWVQPYPHLSDKMVEKLLRFISFEFENDEYGEVEIPSDTILTYPEFYNNAENENIWGRHTDNSFSIERYVVEYAKALSKGSYFYEFSDSETYELFEKKLKMVGRYCSGWCQNNC